MSDSKALRKARERIGQVWCLPQFARREMDSEFAEAIATAMVDFAEAARAEERRECAEQCDRLRRINADAMECAQSIRARGASPTEPARAWNEDGTRWSGTGANKPPNHFPAEQNTSGDAQTTRYERDDETAEILADPEAMQAIREHQREPHNTPTHDSLCECACAFRVNTPTPPTEGLPDGDSYSWRAGDAGITEGARSTGNEVASGDRPGDVSSQTEAARRSHDTPAPRVTRQDENPSRKPGAPSIEPASVPEGSRITCAHGVPFHSDCDDCDSYWPDKCAKLEAALAQAVEERDRALDDVKSWQESEGNKAAALLDCQRYAVDFTGDVARRKIIERVAEALQQ